MGIPRGVVRLLLDEARSRPFSGSLIQLGRMSVFCTLEELSSWAAIHGVALAPVEEIELSHDPRLAEQGCLSDRTFFSLLGLSEIRSCDYFDWEGVDYLFDLNGEVPTELIGRFDVVFEAGTIQHLFHLPNVLCNIHSLLKPGGRVIHGMCTSNNHVDHGFYMFSPTLFWDYYTANRYRIENIFFYEFIPAWFRSKFHSGPWKVYRYSPGCLDHLSYGRYHDRQLGLFVVATKTPEATCEIIPQQGFFVRFWEQQAVLRAVGVKSPDGAVIDSWMRRLEDFLICHRRLLAAFLYWKRLRERIVRWLPRKMPPVVARY